MKLGMSSTIDLLYVLLYVFFACTKCAFTMNIQPIYSVTPTKEIEIDRSFAEHKEKAKNVSYINIDHINILKESRNNNNAHIMEMLLSKPVDNNSENNTTTLNKGISGIALEGGGILQQKSTTLSNNDDGSQSKGSKGRKGVNYPGSSVVARKGVDPLGAFHSNSTLKPEISIHQSPVKELTMPISSKGTSLSSTEMQKLQVDLSQSQEKNLQRTVHAKKPEVVSDIGDTNDFDKYSIIKTSTTGEDYVIIGIVIVIGIWFSVFGALIFYRRAGEYWDRRHYRRMDFLVEGMYND